MGGFATRASGCGSRSALLLGVLLGALLLSACSARYRALSPPPPSAAQARAGLPLLVGVTRGGEGEGVPRLPADRGAERFAAALQQAGLFRGVVYPVSELAPLQPDLWIAVSQSSRYDRHLWRNLASDTAVGLSLLLLQPLLPSLADLEVEIAWEVRTPAGRALERGRAAASTRFESTFLRAPEREVARWHDETQALAIEAAIAQLRSAGASLASARAPR